MKQYLCVICGFIYDEEKGYPDDDIAPGTKWEDVPPTGYARIAVPERKTLK